MNAHKGHFGSKTFFGAFSTSTPGSVTEPVCRDASATPDFRGKLCIRNRPLHPFTNLTTTGAVELFATAPD